MCYVDISQLSSTHGSPTLHQETLRRLTTAASRQIPTDWLTHRVQYTAISPSNAWLDHNTRNRKEKKRYFFFQSGSRAKDVHLLTHLPGFFLASLLDKLPIFATGLACRRSWQVLSVLVYFFISSVPLSCCPVQFLVSAKFVSAFCLFGCASALFSISFYLSVTCYNIIQFCYGFASLFCNCDKFKKFKVDKPLQSSCPSRRCWSLEVRTNHPPFKMTWADFASLPWSTTSSRFSP